MGLLLDSFQRGSVTVLDWTLLRACTSSHLRGSIGECEEGAIDEVHHLKVHGESC